jgi:hypothetical protein
MLIQTSFKVKNGKGIISMKTVAVNTAHLSYDHRLDALCDTFTRVYGSRYKVVGMGPILEVR